MPRRTFTWWALVVFIVAASLTTGVGVLLGAAANGQRAADRARDQSISQADIVKDQRLGQSRRIDLLTDQVLALQKRVADQALIYGRQQQKIEDLSTQVRHLGGKPVALP